MASQAPPVTDDGTTSRPDPLQARITRLRRLGLRLLILAGAVVVLAALALVVVNIETNRLWFASVDAGSVYSTRLRSQIVLFVLGAALAGVLGAISLAVILRSAPAPWPRAEDDETTGWRAWVEQHPVATRRLLVLAFVVYPAYRFGTRAAGHWQAYLLWRHAQDWGTTDPTYGRDLSYYVEVYPFHRFVTNLLASALLWAIAATLVAAIVHGSLRLRGTRRRITRTLVAQLSALGGVALLVKAGSYWLDRAGLVVSNRGPVTGASYTDVHAVGPGKIVLIVVAVLAALLLLANIRLRRGRILVGGVALMVVASLVAGTAWTALVQHLRETPSAATLSLPQIERNQKATTAAFGLGDVTVKEQTGKGASDDVDALVASALSDTQLRVLDPNRLSPTFNVKQQLQAYYGFKSTLDVDRYRVGGKLRDVAIGVRELHANNVSRSTWATQHLVYTHG